MLKMASSEFRNLLPAWYTNKALRQKLATKSSVSQFSFCQLISVSYHCHDLICYPSYERVMCIVCS